MDRTICIRLPEFALQVLRFRIGTVGDAPLITVQDDRPSARVTSCNSRAYDLGVRTGMRYAQALSLDHSIRAGVVREGERRAEMDAVERAILTFVPHVERSRFEEGVFWITAAGLDRQVRHAHGTGRTIEEVVTRAVAEPGRTVRTAHGWSRVTTAVATAVGERIDFPRYKEEWAWLYAQPIAALPLPPEDVDRFSFLGVRTIGELIRLPEGQLRLRFGRGTTDLYRFLHEERAVPVYDGRSDRSFTDESRFEHRVDSNADLIQRIETRLGPLVQRVIGAALWVSSLTVEIRPERGGRWRQRITAGAVTRDSAFLLRLVSLRLETHPVGATDLLSMRLEAACAAGVAEQGDLLRDALGSRGRPTDRRRFEEALAALRAELGDDALVQILPRSDTVPERSLRCSPIRSFTDLIHTYSPTDERPAAIRRVRRIVVESTAPEDRESDGTGKAGSVPRAVGIAPPNGPAAGPDGGWGPFLLSARWWSGREIERVYRYRFDASGDLVWEYTTPGSTRRRRHGTVD
jgi:hypothetical protein